MDVSTPFIGALILFILAQIGLLASQVAMSRNDSKALRREMEAARIADREVTQLKLDALTLSVAHIAEQLRDIARGLGGNRRITDNSTE